MQKQFQSPSPTKRSAFRSKTKLTPQGTTQQSPFESKLKTVPLYGAFLKQFPLSTPEDIFKILQTFELTHNEFIENLDNLKLYKIQLAAQMESNWCDFMEMTKNVITKMKKKLDKLAEDKQHQIAQLLQLNSLSQKQTEKIKSKIDQMQHIRQIQKAELTAANTEVQTVNKQMSDIYAILRSDMKKILNYLNEVEQTKKKQANQGAKQIYASLDNFNALLNGIQKQQNSTSTTLNTMRETIKAMSRSTKTTTGTQVDESELQTKAQDVFGNTQKGIEGLTYDALDAVSVNIVQKGNYSHVLDKLKLKQKQNQHETYIAKKSVEKPWALTPTLLIFLENMSKQNEAGRVVPWQYMKTIIKDIYSSRIKFQQQMISGMVGNGMLFDEFVVFYFLRKYRIRRLAQVKLLEFIISLKYYAKHWQKAQMFCILMDVMRFLSNFDTSDSFNYRVDYYAQNYFFQIYKIMSSFDLIEDDDGIVYVEVKKVKKVAKGILFFTDELSKSRLLSRLDKDNKFFHKVEYLDFDYAISLFLDQYFVVRRRNLTQISRSYSKATQKVQGFFSIDELLGIFNQFSKQYIGGEQFSQKFPASSELHIVKLYLYAVTSGKNSYDITNNNFIQSCQRFGFDSPFPFLHSCSKNKKTKSEINVPIEKTQQKLQEKITLKQTEKQKEKITNQISSGSIKMVNLNQQRIDITSKLFSQHFSILKQLKDYVTIFSHTLSTEKDPETLWKSFNQIKTILQKGCQFLKYPLIAKS